jgi:hypothetical protein
MIPQLANGISMLCATGTVASSATSPYLMFADMVRKFQLAPATDSPATVDTPWLAKPFMLRVSGLCRSTTPRWSMRVSEKCNPAPFLCTGFGQIAAGCADDEVHRVVLAAGSLEGCVSQALVARLVERHQADAGRRLSPHGRHVGGVVGGGGVSHLHPCHTRELLPRGEAAGGSGLGVRRAGVQGRRHRCVGCGIDPGRVVKAAATAPAEGDAGQDGQRNQDFAHRVLRCY